MIGGVWEVALHPLTKQDESGDDGTEQSLSIAQKVKRKLMNMIKIKKGLTVDSGAADHVDADRLAAHVLGR